MINLLAGRSAATGGVILAIATAFPAGAAATDEERPLFTLDERNWVVFYDLPSRRFRSIRTAYMNGDVELAAADLDASAAFLRIESARASDAVGGRLADVAVRLDALADATSRRAVPIGDFDGTFARAHWLLAQHFVELATTNRDDGRHRNAAHYLIATAHHLERTILWSNAVIDDATLDALDGMREVASQLLNSKTPEAAYRQKPIDKALQTLVRLGEHLDRPVVLDHG